MFCNRKFCLNKKIYDGLSYADNGLVIFSVSLLIFAAQKVSYMLANMCNQKLKEQSIGKINNDYTSYNQLEEIGHGGFGRVYKMDRKYAIKEELKVFIHNYVITIWLMINVL